MNETDLWDRLRPNLRGKWRRLESAVNEGFADAVGLWGRKTYWLELKIGKPGVKALRPSQMDFACDCQRYEVPYFVCFWYQDEALFFFSLDFDQVVTPPFYRSPTEALSPLPVE